MTEMPDKSGANDLPEAIAAPRRRRLPLVWVIPLVAALIGGWLVVKTILERGPTITITFKNAEGVEAGKTYVKYKDVNIGQVTAVALSDDYSNVVLTAQIDKRAERLLVEDAKFWVVQPRLGLSGVSGLGTLLSGNYIGFEAGKSDKKQHHFTGLETPPAVTGGQPGRQFVLHTATLGSLGIGSPIYFRRLPAGRVIGYDLTAKGNSMDIKIFVNAPYDRYVNPGTRFWNASGVDVSMSANGFDVRTESVAALLVGGIAFETPADAPSTQPASANSVFQLYKDRAAAMRQPESIIDTYVLHFNDSVRGLSAGAPVTFLGLQIGEVTNISLEQDKSKFALGARVEIIVYPQRMAALRKVSGPENLATRRAALRRFVEDQGLRAQLRSGNLLTGQLYIAFDYFPHAPKAKVDWTQTPLQLPTTPGNLEDMENKLRGIITKLDKMQFDAIGSDVQTALVTLNQTLRGTNKLVKRLDTQVVPGLRVSLDQLGGALAVAARVLNSAESTLLGKDAPAQQELRETLQEITRAARSLWILSDYLERHPSALIRGKKE